MARTAQDVVVDTGFMLSVACVDGLARTLGDRWSGRAAWPTAVRSELRYRVERPGRGIPPGLARKALNASHLWLPEPSELDDDQNVRTARIARLLGDASAHAGEAAAAVLAQDRNGIIATEDLQAARVIRAECGVQAITIAAVLEVLASDRSLSAPQVEEALQALQQKQRPNVDGLRADDIVTGRWRGTRPPPTRKGGQL